MTAGQAQINAVGTVENPSEEAPRGMPSDAELAAMMAEAQGRPPAPRRRSTIADLFVSMVALVKSSDDLTRHKPVSETGRVKLLEIAIMWALNNRTEADTGSVFGQDIDPTQDPEPYVPPTVHEIPQPIEETDGQA
jgi:hypothetical protein